MDININFNGKSDAMDLQTEGTAGDTSFAPDAGAPPAAMEQATDENFDSTASEGADLDMGGPAEWLVEAMAGASVKEEASSDNAVTDDIDDGGSGPEE